MIQSAFFDLNTGKIREYLKKQGLINLGELESNLRL